MTQIMQIHADKIYLKIIRNPKCFSTFGRCFLGISGFKVSPGYLENWLPSLFSRRGMNSAVLKKGVVKPRFDLKQKQT